MSLPRIGGVTHLWPVIALFFNILPSLLPPPLPPGETVDGSLIQGFLKVDDALVSLHANRATINLPMKSGANDFPTGDSNHDGFGEREAPETTAP